jgi:peptidoglycan/xylan/chitin deacetylase (PgdA/CDA1 family)
MTRVALPILVYHSVSDDVTDAFRPYSVSPALFADHVALLKGLGFDTLPLSDAVGRLFTGQSLPERTVVLTFDDAFEDFLENAIPVLRAADFVATLFVPSAYVGLTSRWLVREGEDRRPVMAWTDLQAVADAGIEIGAHSHSHPQLDRLRPAALREELTRSKALLEDHLDRGIATIAYPFGFHSRRVRGAAQAAGYSFACAVGNLTPTSKSNRWAIPRQTVKDTTDVETLRRLLTHESSHMEQGVSEAKRVIWRARRRATRLPLRHEA